MQGRIQKLDLGATSSVAPRLDAEIVEGETPKVSRRWEMGSGYPLPSRLGLEPPAESAQSHGRNWILYNLNAKEAIWWHVFQWIFCNNSIVVEQMCTWLLVKKDMLEMRDRA